GARRRCAAAGQERPQASRLALVGELLGSITHEIRQPLASIAANAAAGLRLAGSREMRDVFTDIRSDGRRATDIIDRLQSLMRKKPLERTAVDLNAIVSEM